MDQINLLKIPYSHRSMTIAELLKLQPQNKSLTFKKGDYIIYRHSNSVFIAQVDKYAASIRKMIINGFYISNTSMGKCNNKTIFLLGNIWVKITKEQYQELEKKYQELLSKIQCLHNANLNQCQMTKPCGDLPLACQPNKGDIFTVNINFIRDHEKVTLGELYDKAEMEYETKQKNYQDCYKRKQNYIGKTFICGNRIMNITLVATMNCGLEGDMIEMTDDEVVYRPNIYLENCINKSYECDSSLFQQYCSYINLIQKLQNDIIVNFFLLLDNE